MTDFPHNIISVAFAQDHSLALTSGGYILSWGHNRFSQLGYAIETTDRPPGATKEDQEIQVTPKRIAGPIKKEWVKGVSAGRLSSACWTQDSVWTWGTNAGHLGKPVWQVIAQLMVISRIRQVSQSCTGVTTESHDTHTTRFGHRSICDSWFFVL